MIDDDLFVQTEFLAESSIQAQLYVAVQCSLDARRNDNVCNLHHLSNKANQSLDKLATIGVNLHGILRVRGAKHKIKVCQIDIRL